jgi:asparagine synthase (glutamine-hydrolysing)
LALLSPELSRNVMCGIAGFLTWPTSPERAEPGLIDRMTDTLAHRGPDGRGTWSSGPVALGHRRLSVIDLSDAGRQPMSNEDGRIQITYNGELYNFRELRKQFDLDGRGHVFRSRTDTEVLVHLFEELGPAMAAHLNGMFALAIWDGRDRTLHLARDPFGVKPLFVHRDAHALRFGSEIKAILADARVDRRLSLGALHDFLSFDYVPGAQTAFEGITEVPPGHWMTISADGQVTSSRYWDVSFARNDALTIETASGRALELMRQAVSRQLVADVPVGVMLSGGLDSSALVALMSREVREPVRSYSVGFEDGSFNELPYARIVADVFKTIRREVVVTPELVRALLPAYLRFIDEPYADGSAIPTYYLAQLAKGEVVVLLSGEGGDEIFAGYETHAAFKASRWFGRVPRFLRRGLIRPIVDALPVSHKKLSLEFKLKRFLGGQDLPPADAHLWWRLVLSEARKSEIYSPEVRERLRDAAPPVRHFQDVYDLPGPTDDLDRLLRIDSRVFLPDDLMIKNDRMTMAHSIEARVPFTDPDLAEFMSTVPASLKLPGLTKKHVMKRALAGVLPREILAKKKVGLEMPYSRWLRAELRDLVDDYLGPERVGATGVFDPAAIQRLVGEHQTAQADHGRALWGLLNYMMWLELYAPRL